MLAILALCLALTARLAPAQEEIVLVDWNPRIITQSDNGFPAIRGCEIPVRINGDWTMPMDHSRGELHMRMEIRNMPVAKDMTWQWCFHQDGTKREECSNKSPLVTGSDERNSPALITWMTPMAFLQGEEYGGPIAWTRSRRILNLVIRNEFLEPVSESLPR